MKGAAGFLLGAIALVIAGFALIGVARLEGHMADAQEQLATQRYEEARVSLGGADEYADGARWVPWLGRDARREIRARSAALDYWQRRYDAVLPAQAEPVAAVDETNVELQLVVANAAYRVGQGAELKNRETTVQTLEEAASGYMTVLKNATWHPDAAYNYEYIIRLRDEAARGKQPPPPPQGDDADLGESGAPTPATTLKGFQIYVPLESGEKNPAGGDAGKSAPKERKG
jgi:hypothetical protein